MSDPWMDPHDLDNYGCYHGELDDHLSKLDEKADRDRDWLLIEQDGWDEINSEEECQCYEVPTLAPTDTPTEVVCSRCRGQEAQDDL